MVSAIIAKLGGALVPRAMRAGLAPDDTRSGGMALDVAAALVGVALQLPPRGAKCVANGYVEIVVAGVLLAVVHGQLGAGNPHVDANPERRAVLLVAMGPLEHDPAALQSAEATELGGFFSNGRLDGGRWLDISKSDLKRFSRHSGLLSSSEQWGFAQ